MCQLYITLIFCCFLGYCIALPSLPKSLPHKSWRLFQCIFPIIICLQTFMICAHSKPVFPLACTDKTRVLPQGHSPGWLSPWSQWGSLGTTWIIKNEHGTLRSFQATEIKKFRVFPPVGVVLNPQEFADKADLKNALNLFIFLLFQKKPNYIFSIFLLSHITEDCVLLLFLPHIATYFHTHGSIPAAKKHLLT